MTSAHISHAVADEGRGGDDGFFGPAGHVGGDECPGEKEGEYEGDCEDVEAPFGPLVLRRVGQHAHSQEADEGGNAGGGHDVHASLWDGTGVEADYDEDYDGDYWSWVVLVFSFSFSFPFLVCEGGREGGRGER